MSQFLRYLGNNGNNSNSNDGEIRITLDMRVTITVELKWLEHLWDHKNKFETGVVRAK